MRNEVMSVTAIVQQVRTFMHWWREELVSLLPDQLRRHLQYSEHQLVVCFSADGAQLTDCRRGQVEASVEVTIDAQGQLSQEDQEQLLRLRRRGGDDVVIRLPQEQVLSLSFPLPLEAENNLDEVLSYELGRHAPFKIEQVYYDYTVRERNSGEKKIWVSVNVVPRKQVEPLISKVRAWGFVPAVVAVSGSGHNHSSPCAIGRQNLLPQAERDSVRGTFNLAAKLLMLLALLLTAAVAGSPILLQEMRIADLHRQVAGVKKEVVSVQSMQLEMEREATESAFVDDKKRQYPEGLDVLNTLTRVLPDDTWLERLEMKGKRIRMQGMSADASSLIELLENSPLLQNVTFDSPIVKDPRIDRFRFQIVAELTVKEEG